MPARIAWPEGKSFAFTIFDDPDLQMLENGRPVYDFLAEQGFRTTKAVWPLPGTERGRSEGVTCGDPAYLKWALELRDLGFEIAFHNATYHTSARPQTIRGLDTFAELFGHTPRAMANHTGCRESIYWGPNRLSGARRGLYKMLLLPKLRARQFEGHVLDSPFFWGDLCRERIRYVRNFVFNDINTLRACPYMPYHDPDRPYVNYWYASSEGGTLESFVATLAEGNQDRLAAEGGACIMYTHFGAGFSQQGRVDSRARFLLERLGRMNGWFVPVSTLLDYLLEVNGHHDISERERSRLERRWLREKMWRGTS